ncbi:aldo/keto reductase [Myxococcus sp. MxC21-1]|uniref:aldo/keto reductase n=1 Tax=Myxococcus sp. MxC21-1 TaxID=3041439 RepID=UPI0039774B4C
MAFAGQPARSDRAGNQGVPADGETPSNVALAWLLHNPVVTAAISGPRTVEQLRQNLKALSLTLSNETLAKLDELWPGPGGEAPNAYAW